MSDLEGGRRRDDDDLPPNGREARAQRKATAMPLVWMILGLIVIAIFVLVLSRGGVLIHHAAGTTPPVKAAAQGPPLSG